MPNNQVVIPFNALNGEELIEVILGEIKERLILSGEFKQHRGFPLVRVRYQVSVNAYPKQTLDEEPKIKAEGTVVIPKDEAVPPIEASIPVVEVKDDITIDTPDKARVKAKIPIKVPGVGPNKVIEDKPVPTKKESK